jgi:hypothetical protein
VRKAHIAVQKAHTALHDRINALEEALDCLTDGFLSLSNKIAIHDPDDGTTVARSFTSHGVINPYTLPIRAALYATTDSTFGTPLSVLKTTANGGVTSTTGGWSTQDYKDVNQPTQNLAAGTYNLHAQARNASDTADLDTHTIQITLM